jgi:uncharacterized membrane protein HdeD (DUF308 family)
LPKARAKLSKRRITWLSLILVLPVIGFFTLPPWVGVLLVVNGMLALVAEFDNQAGTFLPLAILLVIVLAILFILLGMMAFMHG